MKEFFRDFLSFTREMRFVVWSPRVVFIRYFVVTPILILIVWLMLK